MSRTVKLMLAVLVVAVVFGASPAWAGPPFQTDDPEPIDYRNFEFYAFGTADSTSFETDTSGPAVEFNWGALPNVHLHIIVPMAAVIASNSAEPRQVGLGDLETGVKFRFIQESKRRPMVGTFVMFELPTGDSAKGLGVGKTWYKLPLWVQKSIGPWTTYGGGGETVFTHSPGFANYPFAGLLVQRDLGKKLTLGSEAFYHGAEGTGTPLNKNTTLIDIGGYYKFRDPGFQLLFAYGHTVAGQSETYAYVGLYWTWGHRDSGPATTNTTRKLSPLALWPPLPVPHSFGGQ